MIMIEFSKSRQGLGNAIWRTSHDEANHDPADGNFLTIFQGSGALNSLSINSGTVRGVQIANEPTAIFESDFRMPPRHVLVVQDDRAFQAATQDGRLIWTQAADGRPTVPLLDSQMRSHDWIESPARASIHGF